MKAAPRTAFIAEPPAQYLARPAVVVDSSMVCAVLFDEPERGDAESLLSGRRLLAPGLLSHEFLNVALKKLRVGMAESVVLRALVDFADHDIEFMPSEPMQQFALARLYRLSAYDAAYLALAAELKAPLLTFDKRLGLVAQKHLGGLT